jgi:hypothetical protein
MSMPAIRAYLPRYPEVTECSWSKPGKCQQCECRFSLLADRPRIREWDREDLLELVDAMPSTCAIDLARQGPMLLDEVSTYLGLPRAVVEQVELQGLRKLTHNRAIRKTHWDGQ